MKQNILIITILIILGVVGYSAYFKEQSLGSGANSGTIACTVQTVTAATVGTTSSTVLAAHSNRAWARIQQPLNASSTISLAFATGTSATAGSGLLLSSATTTSPLSFIDFGKNTDFPYTGAVTGIVANTNGAFLVAGNASTTVQVTECRY